MRAVLKGIAIALLLPARALADEGNSFDGVWQGTVDSRMEYFWNGAEPRPGAHYRYEIKGTVVHAYEEMNGKLVEIEVPIRIVRVGADAFISFPSTGQSDVVVTNGYLLTRKARDTLEVQSAPANSDGTPARDHRKIESDWLRITKH